MRLTDSHKAGKWRVKVDKTATETTKNDIEDAQVEAFFKPDGSIDYIEQTKLELRTRRDEILEATKVAKLVGNKVGRAIGQFSYGVVFVVSVLLVWAYAIVSGIFMAFYECFDNGALEQYRPNGQSNRKSNDKPVPYGSPKRTKETFTYTKETTYHD